MRWLILFVVLLLCHNSFLWAQQESYFKRTDKNGQDRIFYAGIAAGLNASQIDGDNYSGFHSAGLNVGIISYVKLKPKLFGNLELLYSQKGARNVEVANSPALGSVPLIYIAKLNYIEIPLMLQYQAQERIQAGGGVSYSRLFNAKESKDEIVPSGINNRAPNFKQTDINLLISASYQLSGNIFVRARYQYSLVSIRDANQIPVIFGTPAQFNNLFALQFLLFF